MKKRLISTLLLVTIMFTLVPVEAFASQITATGHDNPFTDVQKGSWYFDAVQYVRDNGFFSGTGHDTFHPQGTMSRGMFVTVLGRMAGVDKTTYTGKPTFSDVKSDSYYAPYVAWASKYGITAGTGDGKFDPDGLITREQMAVFFIRYFETFNVVYNTGANITTTPADMDAVSPWAKEAVLKLWRTGLLSGDGVHFNPGGNASRAQAATLCMRTDNAVEKWYSEPGEPSSPTPTHESSTSDYYKITFVVESSSENKVYKKDTLLGTLPNPAQPTGKVFLGWYHDESKSIPVTATDKLTSNITLYAKYTDATDLSEGGTPNFLTELDQEPNFSVEMTSENHPIPGIDFIFLNISAPEKTPGTAVPEEDEGNIETVVVRSNDSGSWTVSSANGGFTPGHTYQIELISDAVTFTGNTADVRIFNFSIAQDGTLNLKLNDDMKYIGTDDLDILHSASKEYSGLYLASTDVQGNTTYTTNDGSGSFSYTGENDILVGDTVSIYSGTIPTDRKPEKGTTNRTNNDDVSYVKITRIEGNTYYYVAAEAEDVIFTPDILPIDVDEKAGWSDNDGTVTVADEDLDFSSIQYESMGLNEETTVDVGDYLAFYTGNFGSEDAIHIAYGEIVSISVEEDGSTILTYIIVSEDQVISSMDLYDETQLTQEEIQEVINENSEDIRQTIVDQLMQSSFFDDAGEYLASLSLQTDEVQNVFGDGMTLSDCTVTYADGTPLRSNDISLMGNIIDNEQDGKRPNVSVSISPKLSHFDQTLSGVGLRIEVAVSYTFNISKPDSNTVMEVNLTAFFEQEVTIGFSVSGGAVWKWKWIIPYISDFRMNGNLDLGTYTGIGITATAKLTQDDEPWGMPWPNSVREAQATEKVFNLSQSIQAKMEEVEEVLPEGEYSAGGGLAEKYATFMEDANEDWVDLITVKLLDIRGAVDPFHILAYGLQVDFVVSANLNVAIGMTFQYENFKRHSFTLSLKSKKADSDTIDLSTNGYQFDFYVMGSIGLRAGIRAKATVGLFSTKLAGIGLQIEAGAYTRMWGYFYYHFGNWKIKETGQWQKSSSSSGALLVEVGAYLDVKFIAEALNGKYSYAPTLYYKEWPLWTAGQQENVYDFAYDYYPSFDIMNVNTYTLPGIVFDMYWMDLKTGSLEDDGRLNIKNYDSDTSPNGFDETHFAVELSNPNFSYDPTNNLIYITSSTGATEQNCELKITWKGAPLSGSSETLSRIIKLNWSNVKNAGTIAFDSTGGSAVQMLCLITGADISGKMPADPTKLGYIFAGWYTDRSLNNPFMPTTMPSGNTTIYAKWAPDNVSYTVKHYLSNSNGYFELADTDNSLTGLVYSLTTATPKSYVGFTPRSIWQRLITPDGSTEVSVYYDRNRYTLSYGYGGGSFNNVLSVPYGSSLVTPTNPTRTGYIFACWSPEIPSTMPANNLYIEAQWIPKGDTRYTVYHTLENMYGSYITDKREYKYGTTDQLTAAEFSNYVGFTGEPITQKPIDADGNTSIMIYYKRNIHNLSWNVNGGTPLSGNYTKGNVKYGYNIVQPFSPTRTGYTFGGWYTDENLTTSLKVNDTMPDSPLTLYAKWLPNWLSYTVLHIMPSPDGKTITETETLYGYTGRQTTATAKPFTGLTAQPITQTAIAGDGSTEVEIRYTRNSYTVSFSGNGSTAGSIDDMSLQYGETRNLSSNTFTRTGYTFSGWNTKFDGTGKNYSNNASITDLTDVADGNVILYAQWTPHTYTIEFNSNGGSGATRTQASTYGTTTLLSANTYTKAGYTFIGWNSKADGSGTSYADGVSVLNLTSEQNGTITLYAQWSVNTYTVTFNSNSGYGSAMEDQVFTYDEAQVLADNTFSKTGYTFNGWNTMSNGTGTSLANGTSAINLSTEQNGTVTLYAQWKPHTYNIVFVANGGVGSMSPQVLTYDTASSLADNTFSKQDSNFDSWNTAPDGTGTAFAARALVSNLTIVHDATITLYAQWKDASYVAYIGGTGYETLQEAFTAVSSGQTIRLMQNIPPGNSITIPNGKSASFTLDLNGKTFNSGTGYAIYHRGSGTLTIDDTSTEQNGKVLSSMTTGTMGTITLNGGSLVVAGGTVEHAHDFSSPSMDWAAITNSGSGSITVTGGVVTALQNVAIRTNDTSTGSINISGGHVYVNYNRATIYNYSPGNINISGGVVEHKGNSSAVNNLKTGSVTVSGGLVQSHLGDAITSSGNVNISGTALISGGQNDSSRGALYFYSNASVVISGGTIQCTQTYGIAVFRPDNSTGTVTITGATTLKGGGRAMNIAPILEDGIQVTAYTDYAATASTPFDAEAMANYRHLIFE